jgi:hypothetical protein
MNKVTMELDTKLNIKWNTQYEKLVEFKRKKGHCVVPQNGEDDKYNKALGDWVSKQRSYHKNGLIRQDRKELLDEIEFVWKVHIDVRQGVHHYSRVYDKRWHHQYEKLVEFKRKHGNCLVPQGYKQDKSLAIWVNTQRCKKIRQDRKGLLDDIEFVWKVGNRERQAGLVATGTHTSVEKENIDLAQTNPSIPPSVTRCIIPFSNLACKLKPEVASP